MNKKTLAIILSLAFVMVIAIILWFVFVVNKKYEVSFDSSGGSTVETQQVVNKKTVIKPNDPTKEKYDFTGWYLDNELFDFATPITENIQLTAQWVLSDLVMVCKTEDEKPGIATMQSEVTLKFDATTNDIKDASGYAVITFVDKATLEKLKEEVKSMICSKAPDENKCIETIKDNVMKLEVNNDKNLVDVSKNMEGIQRDLESGGFVCELK
ncbi:MAG: InlB B-repeat-containing protein [Mollicutes bacterium]|nr:InlB B-repeat-containing protein [Mollicutes bacterium]